MGTKKILRNTGLLAASGVVALALAAVPATPGLDAGFLGLKAAQAKGNGGNGGSHGNSGNAGGNGHGGGTASAGAGIHGNGVSTESHGLDAQGHGLTASSLEGLNAAHASIQGFANASDDSMVGAIRSAVLEAFVDAGSDDIDTNTFIGAKDDPEFNEIDDDTFAGILGVDEDALEAMKGLVDDKVEVPE